VRTGGTRGSGSYPAVHPPETGRFSPRCRFKVNKGMGIKLYTRWDGLFLLGHIGVSGDLRDLKSGLIVRRYAYEALKVFVPQESKEEGVGAGLVSFAEGVVGLHVEAGSRLINTWGIISIFPGKGLNSFLFFFRGTLHLLPCFLFSYAYVYYRNLGMEKGGDLSWICGVGEDDLWRG